MADIYTFLGVMITTFVDLGLSKKNYFDFLTHLIGSFFSQKEFSFTTSSISIS